jgi:chromosome segregation ATPase
MGRLHSLVSKQEGEIENLLKESERKNEVAEELREVLLKKELDYQVEREDQQQQINTLQEAQEKSLKAAKDQVNSLTKSIEALKAKHEEETRELTEIKEREAKRLAKEAERREGRLLELETALQALRQEAGQTGSLAEDAQAQAANLEAKLASTLQDVEQLHTRLAEKENELAASQGEVGRLRQEHRTELESMAEKLRLAEVETASGREAVTALREDKQRLEAHIRSLAEQSSNTDEQIEKLSLANQELSQDLSTLKVGIAKHNFAVHWIQPKVSLQIRIQ